jgi:hypothetical protein
MKQTINQTLKTVEVITDKEVVVFKIGFDLDFSKRSNQDPYFSITGTAYELGKPRIEKYSSASGALSLGDYDSELAFLDKYHLFSVKEPLHYVANALYYASSRDSNGLLKGEKQFKDEYNLRFDGFPFAFKIKSYAFDAVLKETTDWQSWTVAAVEHINKNGETYKFSPKYTLKNSVGELLNSEWYKCEFDEESEAIEMLTALQTLKWSYKPEPVLYRIGEGKEPNLQAARDSACWLDAELSDFTKEKLKARLPDLMKQFKSDLKKAGIAFPEFTKESES